MNPARHPSTAEQSSDGASKKNVKVLIALPTYGNTVHFDFALALARLMEVFKEKAIPFEYLHTASSHIIRARNFFANYFISHPDFTHLLFLDTDMDFSRDAVYRFFDGEKKITSADVGLSMREWQEKTVDYNASILTDEHGSGVLTDGWVEVTHIGTGIFLVRRDVLEAIVPAVRCYRPPSQYTPFLPDGNFYAFFDTADEDGVYLSEDLSFCSRARAAGHSVWAIVDERIVHHGTSAISGTFVRALAMRGNLGEKQG
jgi:hypothetical protein